MSENRLVIVKDENELDRSHIDWNEYHVFTLSAHYKCPQCEKRLTKIDVPYKTPKSRVRYKPLYRCHDCNIFLKWERKDKQDGEV